MQQLSTSQLVAEIQASTAKLADIVRDSDAGLPVPTCPEWNLRQLATHVGRVHRWAAQIVATRSAEAIPFSDVPDGKYPDNPAGQAAWLRAGADRVIAAVSQAGTAPVWAFGTMAPATFWARRQAHETMVHRVDAELAAGRDPAIASELAIDAIGEWLEIMSGPRYGRPDARTTALPPGATLGLRATSADGGLAGTAEWLVSNTTEGIRVRRDQSEADVTVTGPADRLLLVLLRRLRSDDPHLTVSGDAALFAGWLAGTPF